MPILKTEEKNVFDTAAISRGFFIFGRHKSWEEGVNGLVAGVTEDEILVQFLPGLRNVTNHYRILAEEAAAGEWELRVSANLKQTEEVEFDGTV